MNMKHQLTQAQNGAVQHCGDHYCGGHYNYLITCSACDLNLMVSHHLDTKELKQKEIEHRLDMAGV